MHAHAIQYFGGNIADKQKPDKQKHGPENRARFSKYRDQNEIYFASDKNERGKIYVLTGLSITNL